MALAIEIIDGPNRGKVLNVNAGMTLGRSVADIVIDDPKISSTHAIFESDTSGKLFLVDLDSANGMTLRGVRTKKIAIMHGVTFTVGRTTLRVCSPKKVVATESPQGVVPSPLAIAAGLPWHRLVEKHLMARESDPDKENTPARVGAFDPAISLRFIEGIQINTVVTMGYGPRVAGKGSLDVELLDDAASPMAFEILPSESGPYIQVNGPNVLLNNSHVPAKALVDGDQIRVGNTLIEVRFEMGQND